METVVVNLQVDSSQVKESSLSLKAQLKQATLEAQKLAMQGKENTEEFIKATQKAAELREAIADVNDTINAMHPEAVFNSVVSVAQGIAGGFAAVQGAMALVGVESENVERALLKIQAAMAIAQGLNDIKGLADGWKNLTLVIRNSTIYTKLATAAQAAYNFVVGAGTTGLKLFRGALIATGLGAVVVAIGSLVANWEKLVKYVKENTEQVTKWGKVIYGVISPPIGLMILLWEGIKKVGESFSFVQVIVDKVSNSFGFLKDAIVELLQEVGLLNTAEEDAAEKRIELSKQREGQIKREIDLMKARGATEEEIAQKEIELANEKLLAYKQYIEARKDSGREITDDEKSQLEDLRNENLIAIENLRRVQDDSRKKEEEERKKAYEKWKEEQKKRKEDEERILNELKDLRVENIRDEREREIAEINLTYQRKIAAIKGNSANERQIREELAIQQQTKLSELQTKFAEQDAQREADLIQKRFESEDALLQARLIQADINQQNSDAIKREQAALKLEQDLIAAGEDNNRILLAEAQYQQALTELERKAGEERLATEKATKEARQQIAQNSMNILLGINELFTKDGKKQEKIRKAITLTQIGIDTASAISSALVTANAPTPDNVASGGIAGIAKYVSLAATITANAVKAKQILSGGGGGSVSGGGGSTPNLGNTVNNAPRFNPADSPRTRLEPVEVTVKANVLETDMTKTQKRINKIETDATF